MAVRREPDYFSGHLRLASLYGLTERLDAAKSALAAALLLAAALFPMADACLAADGGTVDPRSGTVRIYVSIATSAAAKLVAALKEHFPNLKVEFVRAGSVETVRRFIAERQAGRIGADLIHGADPGGFEYFAQKGWLDKRLAAPDITKDWRRLSSKVGAMTRPSTSGAGSKSNLRRK